MAQASSRWQQLIDSKMQDWLLLQFQNKALKLQLLHRFRGPGGWLLSLTVAVAMLFWDWRLLLATVMGLAVMILVYWMPNWDWQVHWADIRRFLNSSHSQLTLAAGSGGIATFITYMAASIWIDSDSPWITAGAILQGLGTLTTLIVLVWQIFSWQVSQEETLLDQLLIDLTHADPLKRLIAVRRMTRLVTRTRFDSAHPRTVAESLQLLLNREQEAIIREAVFDSLQALDRVQQLSPSAPLSTSSALKRSGAKANPRGAKD